MQRPYVITIAILLLLVGCPETTPRTSNDSDAVGLPDGQSPDGVPDVDDTTEETHEPETTGGDDPADAPEPEVGEDPADTAPPVGAVLVVNEIMYDPVVVADDQGEYVELFNASDEAVDLEGWTLRDKGSNAHVIAKSVVIEPKSFGVLGFGHPAVDYVYEGFFLSNSDGDSVVLVEPGGTVVDEVSYKTTSPWPEKVAGTSIELIAVDQDNADGANWTSAVITYDGDNFGTPGAPNGQPEAAFEVDPEVVDQQNPGLGASLYFSPHDGLEDIVLERIASAQSHLRLSYFNVRLSGVKWALQAAMEDGVDVEVMLDKKTQDAEFNTMGEDLAELGVPVVLIENTQAEEGIMHHKFMVIDQSVVLVGSANLSTTALNKSDEDLMVIESTDLAQRYLAEYQEIVAGGYAKSAPYAAGTAIQAWMGPEDDLDGKVFELLDLAQSTVLVAMFQVNQAGLIQALIDAHDGGLTVVVVMDANYLAEGGAEITLAEAGIPVILADNSLGMYSEMHSKLLVVDTGTCALGSYNWTNLATFHNDESLVVVDDEPLSVRAAGKFADLLNRYTDDDPGEMGLVTGAQDVTFELSNVTANPGATVVIQSFDGGPWAEPTELAGLSITETVHAGNRLDYRYGVDGPGGIVWETGATHFFTVPYASGPFTVIDAFRP